VENSLWEKCLDHLESELTAQQFNTWIRPLQAIEDNSTLRLLAPNRFVMDCVSERFYSNISAITAKYIDSEGFKVKLEVGSNDCTFSKKEGKTAPPQPSRSLFDTNFSRRNDRSDVNHVNNLRPEFTFENFVEGKSNQLAKAASLQVADNPGDAYNPLFIYGGVGLGKTHLMHAIGNRILEKDPSARVVYINSERFVGDMVFQQNAINEFKRYYRSVDSLLIDDIQFFAKKERSQEEFFHTFNTLIEGQSQIIMTCDRYPKEVGGLEERLQSRFGWGLQSTRQIWKHV